MKKISQLIQTTLGITPEYQTKILATIIVIFIIWLIRKIIVKIVWKRTDDMRIRYLWGKTTSYIAVLLILFILGRVWFQGFQSITTYLGLLSAGLAIALKDLVSNIAGWLFIIAKRPFTTGDRIQIGEHRGDIIDIRVFEFTIMEIGNWVDADQSTGGIIHIPNGKIFTESLANYSKGFQYIWNEIPVMVTFESNWKKAKDFLINIANKHAEHLNDKAQKKVKEASKKFMIYYSKLTPIVYTCVKTSGVLLTLRYLCEPRNRRSSEQGVWEDILDQFSKCSDIDFAYPTQRFYNNKLEGKVKKNLSSEKKGND